MHLPIDPRSGKNKGFAHVQYKEPEAATKALQILDRKPFQGRLLHLMPGNTKTETTFDEFALSKLPLKKQQHIKRKVDAALSIFNWNSMYMNVSLEWRKMQSKKVYEYLLSLMLSCHRFLIDLA